MHSRIKAFFWSIRSVLLQTLAQIPFTLIREAFFLALSPAFLRLSALLF